MLQQYLSFSDSIRPMNLRIFSVSSKIGRHPIYFLFYATKPLFYEIKPLFYEIKPLPYPIKLVMMQILTLKDQVYFTLEYFLIKF